MEESNPLPLNQKSDTLTLSANHLIGYPGSPNIHIWHMFNVFSPTMYEQEAYKTIYKNCWFAIYLLVPTRKNWP